MFGRLFPLQPDILYAGRHEALWILGVLLLAKLMMSANVVFNGAVVAAKIDGLPLLDYSPEAARTVVAMLGLWGIAHSVLCVFGVLVLWHYRALAPLAFSLLLLEHGLRKIYLAFHPLQRAGHPNAVPVNVILLALTVLGLALSLWPARTPMSAGRF